MRFRYIVLLLLFLPVLSFAQWKRLFKFPTGARTIYFLDQVGHPEIGYAGLTNGSIWQTKDFGITWQKKFTEQSGLSITDIIFKDNITGWFCTKPDAGQNGSSSVYRSTDGGISWQLIWGDPGGMFSALYYFTPEKTLYISNWQRGGFSSNDYGDSWNMFASITGINGYSFADKQNGIVTSTSPSGVSDLNATTDGGANWQLFFNLPAAWQPAVKAGTTSFFIFSEYTSTLSRTDAIGFPWNTISTIGSGARYDFTGCLRIGGCTGEFFVQNVFQSISGQGLYKSNDDGITWVNIGGPANEVDSRFWCNGNAVFASDVNGVLSEYISPLPVTLSLSSDTLRLFSQNCLPIDTAFYFDVGNCGQGADTIVSAAFLGKSFSMQSGITPRGFSVRDSFSIHYAPNGLADTGLVSVRITVNGQIIDTVLRIFGKSFLPPAPFNAQLNVLSGTHETAILLGKDTTLTVSVTEDIPASSGLDSMEFDILLSSEMLALDSANTAKGWDVSLKKIGPELYRLTFRNISHSDIKANEILSKLYFSSFLTQDTVATVYLQNAKSYFDQTKHTGCSIEAMMITDSVNIRPAEACGDKSLRDFLITGKLEISILSIRPNPASAEIILETETAVPREASMIIYDDLGKQYYNALKSFSGKEKISIPVSSLAGGNYHIVIKSGAVSVSSDFVKMR